MSSKSVDKSTREWVQLRKKLYLQIRSDVRKLLADAWSDLVPLERKYAGELRQPWRAVSKVDLQQGLEQADIILLGDFHALQQSQRGHLRILRDWREPQQLVLAVEFLQARHQRFINQYFQGKISEEIFLKKIGWNKSWGFPWEHYKPLLDWAKKNKVPLFGINWGIHQKKIQSIKTRENFSSVCLRKVHQVYPDRKIVVIYGDLHLTKSQLPASIKRQSCFRWSRIQRVFQNDEALYFSALNRGLESKLEVVQFRSGDYCIQSVPPWVKWQSYLLFLENTYDRQIEEFDGDIDPTDHVAKLIDFLASEFKVKAHHSSLAIYTADDTHVYGKMRQALHRREWAVVKKWIGEQRSFYVPEMAIGYLGQVTVNHTANLAGEYLHACLSQRRALCFFGRKDFERQIWIQAMAYFGSKVINHKRKTTSVDDLRKSLLLGETKERNRRVLLLALHQKVREVSFFASGKLMRLKKVNGDDSTFVDAARLLGAMLGEKIYQHYRANKWSHSVLKKILSVSVEVEDFPEKYYKVAKMVAQSDRHKSK